MSSKKRPTGVLGKYVKGQDERLAYTPMARSDYESPKSKKAREGIAVGISTIAPMGAAGRVAWGVRKTKQAKYFFRDKVMKQFEKSQKDPNWNMRHLMEGMKVKPPRGYQYPPFRAVKGKVMNFKGNLPGSLRLLREGIKNRWGPIGKTEKYLSSQWKNPGIGKATKGSMRREIPYPYTRSGRKPTSSGPVQEYYLGKWSKK